jgi:plasmid maintenance system antidote protein VapI
LKTKERTLTFDEDIFPPGDLLREELAERGWTVEYFAKESGLSPGEILSILDGGEIESAAASAIGHALGTTSEFWMNLQRLHDEDLSSGGCASIAS